MRFMNDMRINEVEQTCQWFLPNASEYFLQHDR